MIMAEWKLDDTDLDGGEVPLPESTDRCDLIDPFEGFFNSRTESVPSGDRLLDLPLARRLSAAIRRGMENDLYTFQQPLEGSSGPRVRRNGRSYVMLSSYDYLGLIGHPALASATIAAVHRHGTGTGGVRLLSGSAELHRELEQTIARFIGTEAAITFSSGYVANIGVLGALLGPRDVVLVDALVHRSIKDGCRQAGSKVRPFAHNDPEDLRRHLAASPREARIFIVVEGLYSMDGDICPLPDILALKREFGAFVVVDEAHSLGVLGRSGRGTTEHFGVAAAEVDIITGSLSKAIPSNGGFVAGRRDLIIYLQHAAATFFFSAALCPSAAGAAKAAIEILDAEPERLGKLWMNAAMLRSGLQDLGFHTGRSNSPLVPVILGDDESAIRVARDLLRHDIVTAAVIHPAVPKGAARLRLCATAAHSEADIRAALQAFESVKPPGIVGRPSAHRRRPSAIRLEVHARIDDIDPGQWDSLLSPDDLQASHRFIKTCQDSGIEDTVYRHVLVYEGDDLAAVASLCRMTANLDVLAPPALRAVSGEIRRLRPSFLRIPVLFCGLPTSFGQSCLRFAPGADRAAVLRTLAGLTEELGQELGSELFCFKEFGPEARRDLDHLMEAGYLRLPSLPSCRLQLRWPSFEAYLGAMRAGYRRQARADMSTADRRDLRVRRLNDFQDEAGCLHRLYDEVIDRTDFHLERLPRAFFENLNANFEENASALLLECDGIVEAAAILLKGRETMTFLLAGIDQRLNHHNHSYPRLVLEVVHEAFREGVKTLELGQTSYAVKARFGAQSVARWFYLRHGARMTHQLLRLASGKLFPSHPMPARRVFRSDAVSVTS